MKRLKEQYFNTINGGFSFWVVAGFSIAVTFIAGIIDGIARPKKCNG